MVYVCVDSQCHLVSVIRLTFSFQYGKWAGEGSSQGEFMISFQAGEDCRELILWLLFLSWFQLKTVLMPEWYIRGANSCLHILPPPIPLRLCCVSGALGSQLWWPLSFRQCFESWTLNLLLLLFDSKGRQPTDSMKMNPRQCIGWAEYKSLWEPICIKNLS